MSLELPTNNKGNLTGTQKHTGMNLDTFDQNHNQVQTNDADV